MNEGPELVRFEIFRYKCTKWFRSKSHPDFPEMNITDCYHPVFAQGPFPGYSLGGNDNTPVKICPYTRK